MEYVIWSALVGIIFLSGFMLGRRKLRKVSKITPLQLALSKQRMKDVPAEVSKAYLHGFEMGAAAERATQTTAPR